MYTNVAIKTSKIKNAGVGLFAKKSFKKGELIHVDICIYVPDIICNHTTLSDYVIPSSYPYNSLVMMGPCSFLNDGGKKKRNVIIGEIELDEEHTQAHLIATKDIKEGAELLLDYNDVVVY